MITFLCPTRHRPEGLKRLIFSALNNSTNSQNVKFGFYIDDDDQESANFLANLGEDRKHVWYIQGPRLHMLSEASNILARATEGILFFCGDDVEVETKGWDYLVEDTFDHSEDKILLLYGDDGIQGAKLATHFFIHKEWVHALGHVIPPIFTGDWVDNWVTEVSTRIGRKIYLPELKLTHHHCTVGKSNMDLTYYEKFAKDAAHNPRAVFESHKHLRDLDVEKLTNRINNHV